MSTMRNRVKALETALGSAKEPRRVYMLIGNGDDEAIADFIHAEGWAYEPDKDIAIHLVPIEPDFRDGRHHGPKACTDPELTTLRLSRPPNPAWRLEAA